MKKARAILSVSAVIAMTIGLWPSVSPAPEFIPCPTCQYKASSQSLTGTIDEYAVCAFPFTDMTLVLKSTTAVLDTVYDLTPQSQSESTVLDQTIDTDVSSGVVKAELQWQDADDKLVTQEIDVVP